MIKITYRVSWPIACKVYVEDAYLNELVSRLVLGGVLLSAIKIEVMNFSNPIEVTGEKEFR